MRVLPKLYKLYLDTREHWTPAWPEAIIRRQCVHLFFSGKPKPIAMHDTARTNVKVAAQETIDQLPDDTTWEELLYRLYVRQKIEAGRADAGAGNVVSFYDVCKSLNLGR